MKKSILAAGALLLSFSAQADDQLTCNEGQTQVVACVSSATEDVFLQEVLVCKEGNNYLIDTKNWKGEALGQLPAEASLRTGASTYKIGDDEVEFTLVVSSRPSRVNGKIVRAGVLTIKDSEHTEKIKMDCSR